MEKAFSSKMERCMMEAFHIIKWTVTESLNYKMVSDTKGNGYRMRRTELAYILGQMEVSIKESM